MGGRRLKGQREPEPPGSHGDAPTQLYEPKASSSAQPAGPPRRERMGEPRSTCPSAPPSPGTVPAARRCSPLLEALAGSAAQKQRRGRRTAAGDRGSPMAAARPSPPGASGQRRAGSALPGARPRCRGDSTSSSSVPSLSPPGCEARPVPPRHCSMTSRARPAPGSQCQRPPRQVLRRAPWSRCFAFSLPSGQGTERGEG